MYKICTKCKTSKDITNFRKDKYTRDGYTSRCKSCIDNKYDLTCQNCNKNFKGSHKTQKFCGNECKHNYLKGENNGAWKNAKIITTCAKCNNEFETFKSAFRKNTLHFCNNKCKKEYFKNENHMNFKKRIIVNCKFCGKEYKEIENSPSNNGYCSVECSTNYKKINYIGENNPNFKNGGITFNCEYCGTLTTVAESQYKNSNKHFCSIKCSNKFYAPSRTGEKAWNWNPNLSEEDRLNNRDYKEYVAWRKKVFIRDKYTCQCCGVTGGDLEAHHKNGYDNFIQQRLDINNGITLCAKCHKDFHKKYGYGNNTLIQFQEWIINNLTN